MNKSLKKKSVALSCLQVQKVYTRLPSTSQVRLFFCPTLSLGSSPGRKKGQGMKDRWQIATEAIHVPLFCPPLQQTYGIFFNDFFLGGATQNEGS